jgi:hypothetical protein
VRLRAVVNMRILSALPSSVNKNCSCVKVCVHLPSSCISFPTYVQVFVYRWCLELVEDVWFNVLEDSEEIILGHFTHLENNTCVVIHHALKRLSDRSLPFSIYGT